MEELWKPKQQPDGNLTAKKTSKFFVSADLDKVTPKSKPIKIVQKTIKKITVADENVIEIEVS